MMENNWVQTSLLLGATVGVGVSGWLPLIHPAIHLLVAVYIGVCAMWIGTNARGTNGW